VKRIEGGSQMTVRLTITSQIEQVAQEQQVKLPPLTDTLVLLDSGLDSLGFAILVARLEDTLGFDPFTASDDVYFPVTLGDFIGVYENAAKSLEVAS
jgi:acyl carrier protein